MRKINIPLLLLSLIATTAIAGTPNTKKTEPLQVKSNSVEYLDSKNMIIYTGNVEANNTSQQLHADTLTIYLEKGKIIEAIAKGNPATVKAKSATSASDIFAKARVIKYYPDEDKADLFNDAKVIKDNNEIQSEHLSYFFQTGDLIAPKSNTRTLVTFYPKGKQ